MEPGGAQPRPLCGVCNKDIDKDEEYIAGEIASGGASLATPLVVWVLPVLNVSYPPSAAGIGNTVLWLAHSKSGPKPVS